MREIKFRGKRYGDEAWVYGSLYRGTKEGEKYSVILNDSGYHLAPPDDRNLAIAFAENEVNMVIPDTIGQFTGLHDKNGKEIYEGDILRGFEYPFYDAQADAYNYYAIVDWDANEAQFYAYHDLARGAQVRGVSCGVGVDMEDLREMEVIGNIFDNLGLLKA